MTTPTSHTQALGIDVGGSSIKVALMSDQGDPILEQSESYSSPDPEAFERVLSAVANRPAMRAAMAQQPPKSVGVCLPGVWNESGGFIERSNNLPKLVGVAMKPLFERALGFATRSWTVSTDVHATAIDLWHELARVIHVNPDLRPRRLFCLALGTGVGACVLDEGSLLRINGNSSGHFGQIDVTVAESGATPPVAADGGVGTLEAYWAAAAVAQRQGSAQETLDPILLETLARALRIAHAMYRPDAIVLAGGTSLHLRHHGEMITAAMRNGLSSIARSQCEVHIAAHAHHAALGIARLAVGSVR